MINFKVFLIIFISLNHEFIFNFHICIKKAFKFELFIHFELNKHLLLIYEMILKKFIKFSKINNL